MNPDYEELEDLVKLEELEAQVAKKLLEEDPEQYHEVKTLKFPDCQIELPIMVKVRKGATMTEGFGIIIKALCKQINALLNQNLDTL